MWYYNSFKNVNHLGQEYRLLKIDYLIWPCCPEDGIIKLQGGSEVGPGDKTEESVIIL